MNGAQSFPREIRRIVLEQSRRANVGHIGSALSIADIVAATFDGGLNIPAPEAPDRDRFLLSKGHAALALYAALHLRGWLPEAQLDTFCADESLLGVHPERVCAASTFRPALWGTDSRLARARRSQRGFKPRIDEPACCSAMQNATKGRRGRRSCSRRITSCRGSSRSSFVAASVLEPFAATRSTALVFIIAFQPVLYVVITMGGSIGLWMLAKGSARAPADPTKADRHTASVHAPARTSRAQQSRDRHARAPAEKRRIEPTTNPLD